MLATKDQFIEFDFFMDEDTRSKRIGILCLEKSLTPALTQALFRVKESANEFHKLRIEGLEISTEEKAIRIKTSHKQIREIKWSSLNVMRSFVAIEFLRTYFHYCRKGPLPITFFNTPFVDNHKQSISYFFKKLSELNIEALKNLNNSQSIFFLDAFTTAAKFRFEEKVRDENNLARCFRIDSKAHNIMQLTDILLGLTVLEKMNKKIKLKNKSKLRVIKEFKEQMNYDKKSAYCCDYIYYID